AGVVHDGQRYLVEGGPANLRELHRFLSDTVLLTGSGFEPPASMPVYGVHGSWAADPGRPTVGIVSYRAHALSGNTGFVDALCSAAEAAGANPLPVDAAMQVAIPEFDGRLVSVPFSFKETGPDGVPVYVADPERAARVAGIALGYARLRRIPNQDKRLAIVLSSYPTRHSRVGNAVG